MHVRNATSVLAPTPSPPRQAPATLALYFAFVISGAAGLIYESIWSRYLGLFVGHGAYAQIIVLVIFLGGMSLGALLAGRHIGRIGSPLLWYAGVEIVVALLGFAFHGTYLGATELAYDRILPALPAGAALTSGKWLIAAALILPQSILLGASFPLMSAGVLRRADSSGRPGRVLGMLYFGNSLGAAFGVLLSGFVLMASVGLPGTLVVAATANLVVAGIAIAVAQLARADDDSVSISWTHHRRPAQAIAPAAASSADPPQPAHTPDPALWRALLAVSFGTAVASFIYEIAWIRMLSLVLGSATHSFELMLSAFILGLALGAFWIGSRADRLADPILALSIAQWVMGALAIATIPLYLASFRWTAFLLTALDGTPQGYSAFTLARYAICLAIMLPATFCAGVTLPLITRTLLTAGGHANDERAIGAVYGVNTLGSIVGVVLAGLVLMPLLGLRTMLIAGALLDMAIGAALILRRPGGVHQVSDPLRIAAAASAVCVVAIIIQSRFDRGVLVSGVYRYEKVGRVPPDELVFYRDGRTATVSGRVNPQGYGRSVSTNGKPDASLGMEWYDTTAGRQLVTLGGDAATQAMLPIVTLAHAPHASTAAVIGLGSGMTSQFLLGSPGLEEVVTIEIEPEMIRAAREIFQPANQRVFDDPRSRIVVDDAKSHFAAARRRYDLIISEPSNPWVSGVSGLFTREFYERAAEYLTDDGVFGQWIHLYELNDELMLTVVAALHETFPSYEIHHVSRGDMLIIASRADTLRSPDWSIVRHAGIADDLSPFHPLTPAMLDRTWAIGRAELEPIFELGRQANSDFHPILDLGAERARYARQRAIGFSSLGAERLDLAAMLAGRRVPFSSDTRTPIADIASLEALASGARFREWLHGARTGDSSGFGYGVRDQELELSAFRHRLLEESMQSGSPPPSWRYWVRLAFDVEQAIHGGTSGVVDEAFYQPLFRYMEAQRAPAIAVAAIDFRYGLATWDFHRVARAAEVLADSTGSELEWVPPAELRDGAVIALLGVGDHRGARTAFTRFTPRVGDDRDDLRSWLVAAHLRVAERRAEEAGRSVGSAFRRAAAER